MKNTMWKAIWCIVAALLVCTSRAQSGCLPPFVELETGCYFFSSDLRNYWEAYESCLLHDSVLATVETAEEDAAIIKQVAAFDRPFWLGGSDRFREGLWVWEATCEPFLYTGWENGQPKTGEVHNCLVYWKHHTYKWHDWGCLNKATYICERGQVTSRHKLTAGENKGGEECFRASSCDHYSLPDVCFGTKRFPTQTYSSGSQYEGECDAPFIQLATGCYYFSSQSMNWWEAVESCRNHNSVLATVETPQENLALIKQARKENHGKSFWLGGFDMGHEGRWLWESTQKPLLYTAWKELVTEKGLKYQQPDNSGGNEHCLHLAGGVHNYKWNDYPCDRKSPYICQRLAISTSHGAFARNSARTCNCPAENNINFTALN